MERPPTLKIELNGQFLNNLESTMRAFLEEGVDLSVLVKLLEDLGVTDVIGDSLMNSLSRSFKYYPSLHENPLDTMANSSMEDHFKEINTNPNELRELVERNYYNSSIPGGGWGLNLMQEFLDLDLPTEFLEKEIIKYHVNEREEIDMHNSKMYLSLYAQPLIVDSLKRERERLLEGGYSKNIVDDVFREKANDLSFKSNAVRSAVSTGLITKTQADEILTREEIMKKFELQPEAENDISAVAVQE